MILQELSRKDLLNKSKYSDNGGKQRFKRRLKSKIMNSTKEINNIDMDKLFRKGILTVDIKVQGETNQYLVKVSVGSFVKHIQRRLRTQKFDIRTITQAIMESMNDKDVYVHCSCPDFCLTGDTQIKLLSGEVLPIEEIVDRFINGEDMWTYSVDENGDFGPGHITDAFVSGYVNDTIVITLDNGKTIETTPNHKYMLRNGTYLSAEELVVGMSLMPLYFSYHNGYESVKCNSDTTATKFYSVYKQVAESCLLNEIREAESRMTDEDTCVQIHHKDFNKLNNNPTNLIPLTNTEHWRLHYNQVFESGQFEKFRKAGEDYWATDEARHKQAEVMSNVMRKYYDSITTEEISAMRYAKGYYSDEWKNKVGNANKSVWENYTEEEYLNRCAINKASNGNQATKQKQSDARKKYHKDHPELAEKARENIVKAQAIIRGVPMTDEHKHKLSLARQNETQEQQQQRINKYLETINNKSDEQKQIEKRKSIDSKIFNTIKQLFSEGLEFTEENYELIRKRVPHNSTPKLFKYFSSIEEVISYFNLVEQFNHKIVSIERKHYDEEIPVYDLSIDNYHNFYVDAGVILHNCYRFAYWSTRNKYNSGEKQPSNGKWIRNPLDDKGSACKHTLLVLSNLMWVQTVARTIYNYVLYMEEHYEDMYARLIYPKLYYRKKYNKDTQIGLFDTDELQSDNIQDINDERAKSTQFKQGNKAGYKFASGDEEVEDENQLSLDL